MSTSQKKPSRSGDERRVTLKTIAQRLGLTAGTASAVLNNSAASRSIPDATKQRILKTARELGYSPNYFARSLRLQRAYTIGVIAEEIVPPGTANASNLGLCFPYAVFAQMLATLQSLALGLRPDTPNARGVVNRVVQGVTLYPWKPSR